MSNAEPATTIKATDLAVVDLELHPNEASGLAAIQSATVLAALGWDRGLVTVLDEGRIEECIAIIGHRAEASTAGAAPAEGWEIHRLKGQPTGKLGATQDCESVAIRDGWVYLFGSHFGAPDVGLETSRAWLARFKEEALSGVAAGTVVEIQIIKDKFRLHRAVNDGLAAAKLTLLPVGPAVRKQYINRTRRSGTKDGKRWAERIHSEDVPINIEGATFRADGALLLGLRFPCTADGHALLVEVNGIEKWFDDLTAPVTVAGVWTVDGVGSAEEPVGVRDLEATGDELHLLVGNLDAEVLVDGPEVRKAACAHWHATLPADHHGGHVTATFVRDFPGVTRMEGISLGSSGHPFYVSDEDDRVQTRFVVEADGAPGAGATTTS